MKSLISTDDGSDLSQISPVLTCIRTLNESGFIFDEERSKFVKRLSLRQLKCEAEISKKDGFWFVVSLHDGACLYTSQAITNHLGYPKDMLVGQCFMNFLYDKDHLTFANHLTQGLNVCFTQGKRDESHLVLNTFFCRIRVYQGLKFGYAIAKNKPQYKPFKIILHINELILDDMCVEKPSATLCVKATATQVLSAYSVPKEIPAMTSFSTRHTASCHFSHVDASAIPYLGFLPQDMVGYSVFDFYHVDDMSQLKAIYELVIKKHGTSFRSKPYRFKVNNGCYIMLETEWSCFINPWSHKLEFVVGQHRVLKGPSDISIFTPCEILGTTASEEVVKESQIIQEEIKVILSQSLENVVCKKNKRICNKRKRDLASFVSNCIDETYKGNKTKEKSDKKEVKDNTGSHSDPDSVVMGDISPYREINDSSVSSPPTVQQIQYQQNIERFFASQPKMYSDSSDDYNKNEKLSIVEEYHSSTTGSGNGSGSCNVSGNASKDQQSGSPMNFDNKIQESVSNSSKCNMSSFTTGDSGYGKSWGKEGTNDPGSNQAGPSKPTRAKKLCGTNNNSVKFSACLALTEETLSAHNKISSHKQFKQQHKNKLSFDLAADSHMESNWLQQNDSIHSKQIKNPCCHNLSIVTGTPTIVTNKATVAQSRHQCSVAKPEQSNGDNSANCLSNAATHSCHHFQNPCMGFGSASTPIFIPVLYLGNLPCYPSISSIPQPMTPFWPCTQASNGVESNKLPLNSACEFSPNMIAPSFPYPVFPTLYGSPNCNGIPHGVCASGVTTTSLLSTTTTTLASGLPTTFKNTITGKENRSLAKTKVDVTGDKIKIVDTTKQDNESNESDMQIEELMSSSFTKSSSLQSQDKVEDMDLDLKHFYPTSNKERVELSTDIAFRYQMNVSNVDDILKKDREALKSMQQPALVNKQLMMLQEEIEEENESKPKAEDNFCVTDEIMLGFTAEEAVNEELEYREACLLQLMCEES